MNFLEFQVNLWIKAEFFTIQKTTSIEFDETKIKPSGSSLNVLIYVLCVLFVEKFFILWIIIVWIVRSIWILAFKSVQCILFMSVLFYWWIKMIEFKIILGSLTISDIRRKMQLIYLNRLFKSVHQKYWINLDFGHCSHKLYLLIFRVHWSCTKLLSVYCWRTTLNSFW